MDKIKREVKMKTKLRLKRNLKLQTKLHRKTNMNKGNLKLLKLLKLHRKTKMNKGNLKLLKLLKLQTKLHRKTKTNMRLKTKMNNFQMKMKTILKADSSFQNKIHFSKVILNKPKVTSRLIFLFMTLMSFPKTLKIFHLMKCLNLMKMLFQTTKMEKTFKID